MQNKRLREGGEGEVMVERVTEKMGREEQSPWHVIIIKHFLGQYTRKGGGRVLVTSD